MVRAWLLMVLAPGVNRGFSIAFAALGRRNMVGWEEYISFFVVIDEVNKENREEEWRDGTQNFCPFVPPLLHTSCLLLAFLCVYISRRSLF